MMLRRTVLCAVLALQASASNVLAQGLGGGFGGGGLGGGGLGGGGLGGGIVIDPKGVLRTDKNARTAMRVIPAQLERDLATRAELRQVSLKQLDRQLRDALAASGEIPQEVQWLAGLVKIEYVIFDPANLDVLLAGPAEGWQYTSEGRAIGSTTKRPVLFLGDLAAALRCVLGGPGEVHCSIDPQREGLASARDYYAALKQAPDDNRAAETIRSEFTRRLDLQVVTTQGVPAGSRFARVLVEADYRMKRMAIGIEKMPGLPTHLDAVVEHTQAGDMDPTMARWWFTSQYEPFLTNADQTVFRFRGPGVRLLNEEMFVGRDGSLDGAGRPNRDWDRFSQTFTRLFARLETQFPVFADLHNLFDLMVTAGLIQQQQAGTWLDGSALLDSAVYQIPTGLQPKWTEPVFTYRFHTRKDGGVRRRLFSIAYGGVSIRPTEALATPFELDRQGELDGVGGRGSALATEKPATADSAQTQGKRPEADSNRSASRWWADMKRPSR
jgi:hypothetical protein